MNGNVLEVDGLLERSLRDIGIPPCPAILSRFMDESQKDEPDYHRLSEIVGSDVGISAGLIKTANSPFFGMRQRVRSVNEALTVLGLRASSRAVAGLILRNTFPYTAPMERFWDASARIANLSGWLVQHLRITGIMAEDAYTFGLFRDCGIPILMKRFPNYRAALDAANRDGVRSFIEVEQTEMPTNHAMVGCILSQSWWLPEEICLAIRNHHDLAALSSVSSRLPTLSRKLIAISQLAEYLVQQQLGLSFTREWPKLGAACLQTLGLEEAQLETLYAESISVTSASE
jgi:HD-like signal output (HDOD) protein